MPNSLYVTALEPQSGKTIAALGFMEQLSGRLKNVGVFRPIIADDCGPDRVITLLKALYHGQPPAGGECGIALEEVIIPKRFLEFMIGKRERNN